MSTEELKKRIDDEYVNLENLKFQHATTRIQNTAALKKSRHLIARMKTIVRQRELSEKPAQEYTTETTKEE
jgi:large subunit ribosomal protein L29